MLQSSFCTIAFQEKKWGKDVSVERPLFDILPLLAEAGYHAAEIWAPHAMDLEPEQLPRLFKMVQWEMEKVRNWEPESLKAIFQKVAEKEGLKMREKRMDKYLDMGVFKG